MAANDEADMPSQAELEEIFTAADADGNGAVDMEEFVQLYRSAEESRCQGAQAGGKQAD